MITARVKPKRGQKKLYVPRSPDLLDAVRRVGLLGAEWRTDAATEVELPLPLAHVTSICPCSTPAYPSFFRHRSPDAGDALALDLPGRVAHDEGTQGNGGSMDIKLHVVEDETTTIVHTVLDLRGDHFESTGRARRNPTDPPAPLVGEELAIARALQDLSSQLIEAAQAKIEAFAG